MTRASEIGIQVHLETVPHGVPAADALRQLVAEDRADAAVILTFQRLAPDDVRPLDEAGLPFVLVNRHFGHYPITLDVSRTNWVVPDWVGGTKDAVEKLARLGHRSLVALFCEGGTSTLFDHEAGWHEGVSLTGLDPALTPVLRYPRGGPGDIDNRQGYELGKRLLTGTHAAVNFVPTAILTFNDSCAHGVLRAARELGVQVPESLSVIGFDDSIARFTFPALCSYNPEFHLLGVHAADTIGTLLRDDPRRELPLRVTVPLRYECRESCGPAPIECESA